MNNGSLSLSKFFPLSQSFFLSLRCGWMRWFLCSVWKMRSAFRRSTTTIVVWPTTATQQRCPWCLWELRVSLGEKKIYVIYHMTATCTQFKAIFSSGLATIWIEYSLMTRHKFCTYFRDYCYQLFLHINCWTVIFTH